MLLAPKLPAHGAEIPAIGFGTSRTSGEVTAEQVTAALKAGYIETLLDAGAVVTPATCGACGGGHMGVLGANETCITASTRNFKGRMGDPTARIFMGSPATVAASAIAGVIADPGDYVKGANW